MALQDQKYIQTYLESVMNQSVLPKFHAIHDLFSSMSREEFLDTIDTIMKTTDRDSFLMLLYYIIIFRDLEIVQTTFNDPNTPIDLLEKLVMFAMGHCSLQGYTTERVLDEILSFISKDKMLDLIMQSNYVSRDKLLLFFILTKLDNLALDQFFKKQSDIAPFIECFLKLPDEVMKSIIARNYRLFQYIMLMMSENVDSNVNLKKFYAKYQTDIEQLSQLGDVIRTYKSKVDLGSEKDLPFNMRDMNRISFLVNKIRSLPDPQKAIEYFAGEGMFADDSERQIIVEVISNPVFRNTFQYYDSVFIKD
jgi:hypothetical protein